MIADLRCEPPPEHRGERWLLYADRGVCGRLALPRAVPGSARDEGRAMTDAESAAYWRFVANRRVKPGLVGWLILGAWLLGAVQGFLMGWRVWG